MNIDGELEDTEGVISSTTHYAKQVTVVEYDTQKINEETLVGIIKDIGYEAQIIAR